MHTDSATTLTALRARTHALKDRAHVPFSQKPAAALALLDDGRWIPGVRVESAAFPLSLTALANVATTAVSLGCADVIVAFVLSESALPADAQYARALPAGSFEITGEDVLVRSDWTERGQSLPSPGDALEPFVTPEGSSPKGRIEQARRLARRAHVPISDFPVGALLETTDGRLIPGVNVEHEDWTRILCAERNALSAALSYGLTDFRALYLASPLDAQSTPCGACRQWLVELAPELTLWMDRHAEPPAQRSPHALLPDSFGGQAIPRRRR